MSESLPNLGPALTVLSSLVPVSAGATAIAYTAAFAASVATFITAFIIACSAAIFYSYFCLFQKCLYIFLGFTSDVMYHYLP